LAEEDEDESMSNPPDPGSIIFQAACNEAVEASMRPIRHHVLNRLANRCNDDSQLSKLLSDTWDQAQNEIPNLPLSSWRDKLIGNKFVNLIANDPQWKTAVLTAVVQERRWSDLWSRGYELFSERVFSLVEKLNSPNHPTARITTGALTSFAAVLLAIWIPPKITRNPDFYEETLRPLLKPFQSKYEVPLELKPKTDGVVLFHLKAVIDDKDLTATIKPVVKSNDLFMTFHPTLDASLKITPQIEYPSESFGNPTARNAKSQALTVRLVPAVDFPSLPKGLWDPKVGLRVSVTELDAPTKSATAPGEPSNSNKPATGQGALLKDVSEADRPSRPLDMIESDLGTLNKSLETLGGDFQASKSDPKSNLAALEQDQNSIHSIADNHGRTTVIEATPNSVHSVVLQWVGEDTKPQFCTLTLQLGNIGADKLDLSVTKQQCSSNVSLVGQIPHALSPGPSEPQQLGPWILSVDETHRRRIFQHAATLRFTWQPTAKSETLTTQARQKSP
jgi:hypothetical protein